MTKGRGKKTLDLAGDADFGGGGRWNRQKSGLFNVTHGALCNLFTQLDRVLAGPRHKKLTVRKADTHEFPSATDGTQVLISADALNDAVERRGMDMMSLFGLNYHELAHVLYTPQLSQQTRMWVSQNPWRAFAFNILEDNRIEHMIRQEYPKMTVYFLAAVYKYYFDVTSKEFNTNWRVYAATAERRYIPREDREDLRRVMVNEIGEYKTSRVEAITAKYIRMVHITSSSFLTQQQQNLVEELAVILANGEPTGNSSTQISVKVMCNDHSNSHGMGRETEKRKPTGEVKPYEDIDGDDADDADGGSGEGKDGEEEKPSGAKGFSRRGSATLNMLDEAASGSVEIQNDMQLADQIVQKAEFKLERGNAWLPEPVDSAMILQRDKFRRELEKIQIQVDPGWEDGQAQGRLSVDRVMRGDPYDTVFDDWMEDKSDAVQIEAMMLADQSGSMAGMAIKQASKAFWIVASALDVIEAKVTQIGYSDSSYEIRGPKDRESSTQYKKMGTTGGTNPRVAIAKAAYELIDSEARHRLFIMYTDGGWYSTQDDEDILNMRKNGVTTVMFFLNTDGGWYSYTPPDVEDSRAHNCEYFYEITDGTQIADVASKLVIAMTKTAAASMGR